MRAEIISVGTELLLGQVVDTNAAHIARALAGLGFSLYRKTTVGDNRERLAAAVSEALSRVDVIIMTGGLGPTEDDLTRETVADVLGVRLVEDPGALHGLERAYAARGVCMPPSNRKQALVPEEGKGRSIPNPLGTAPGVAFECGHVRVICMPGVPREMVRMMDEEVAPYLRNYLAHMHGAGIIKSRSIRTIGIGESRLEEVVYDLAHGESNPTVATYAHEGECELRITARADSEPEADALLAKVEAEVRARLGNLVYGFDSDTLETVVARRLAAARLKLCCAESCTGGLISGRLTSVPGSSGYFDRGFITYSNRSKTEELGVSESTLEAHGAVSRETAIEMANGAAGASCSDIGVSVTGIAGPDGGTVQKPVGLVFFGLVDRRRTSVITARIRFAGDRDAVRTRACKFALDLLRRDLEEA